MYYFRLLVRFFAFSFLTIFDLVLEFENQSEAIEFYGKWMFGKSALSLVPCWRAGGWWPAGAGRAWRRRPGWTQRRGELQLRSAGGGASTWWRWWSGERTLLSADGTFYYLLCFLSTRCGHSPVRSWRQTAMLHRGSTPLNIQLIVCKSTSYIQFTNLGVEFLILQSTGCGPIRCSGVTVEVCRHRFKN